MNKKYRNQEHEESNNSCRATLIYKLRKLTLDKWKKYFNKERSIILKGSFYLAVL